MLKLSIITPLVEVPISAPGVIENVKVEAVAVKSYVTASKLKIVFVLVNVVLRIVAVAEVI